MPIGYRLHLVAQSVGKPKVQEAPEAPQDDCELARGEKRSSCSDQEHAGMGGGSGALFDGSWASQAEEITNVEVARRFDAYSERLACFVDAQERTADETLRLGHLFKVFTHLRPGLVHCYDIEGFPRTNNEMERTIRAIKMQYRRISGRKNWNTYLLRYGRCVAYQEWWQQQPDGEAQLQARLRQVIASSWRQVRQETRHCHMEQLNRFRFRHRPLDYLAALEMRWGQSTGTGVLPP